MRKAFGLKGELVVQPSTDEPGEVFAPGRRVFATGIGPQNFITGQTAQTEKATTTACTIERSRPFKDVWLVKLVGVEDKTAADRSRENHDNEA